MATEDTAPGTGDAAPRHRTSTTPPVAIHPFRGAAGVSFGAGRADVRQRLGAPAASYRAPAWQDQLSDHYPGLGLVIGYGDAGTVDRIELSAPPAPRSTASPCSTRAPAPCSQHSPASGSKYARSKGNGKCRPGAWPCPYKAIAPATGRSERWRPSPTARPRNRPISERSPTNRRPLQPDTRRPSKWIPGAGPVRLGLPRPRIRALLGEGLASALPGRDTVDFHYDANIAVTYDAAEAARRICVMTADATIANLPSTIRVGAGYRDCVTALREADLPHEEHEAEILLTDLGIRLLTSRAGDRTLPITGIAVQRAPAL
ncbi:hypothetical protein ACFQ9X_10700 [Catenulispora yoronensis]